ncbi:hypothetical protein KI387_003467, partial [Taxus chinensis]
MDSQVIQMENIPDNVRPNGNKEIKNKDRELEDRSWYIFTILIRIGRPSFPKEISERCTIFSISPVEVEALCCIPESPICMIEGHMVSLSEFSTSLFYDVSPRFADPLDLVVPDTPVSNSSPSRTCRKGACLHSAFQSSSWKGNSRAIQDNNTITPPLFGIDLNIDSTSVAHRKSSCHDTTACMSKLDTDAIGVAVTCTDIDMVHIVSSASKDLPLVEIDYAKPVDLSLKYSRKRPRKDQLLTNIGPKSPPKPLKVARSIFPESFNSVEPFPPTEQYFSNPPAEPVNPEVADGANQVKTDMNNSDRSHYQWTLDYTITRQSPICHPKKAIVFDIQDDSKPNCLLDGSHANETITNNANLLQRRHGAIAEDIGNKDNSIGATMSTFLKSKSPNRDDCTVHNESDRLGLEDHPMYSHAMFASDCQNKFNFENAIYHKDDTSKVEDKNIADDGRQSDRITLDLILNSISEREGQKNSLLCSEAKEGGPAGCNRQNNVELNHRVLEISVLPVQDPDHSCMQINKIDVRNQHVMGEDVNLFNEDEFKKESWLAQTNSEEENTHKCNYDNITKYTDGNISMDKEALTTKNNSLPKMLDASYVKGMAATEVILSQEYNNVSSTQKKKGHAKGLAFHNGATAGDTTSSQKRVESRCVPIFKFFTVEEEEGSGGYGTVYKARRKQDAKIFAIKCPLEQTPKTSVTNEFLMLQRFGGSNFIIKLEDVVQNNGQDCLILEYVVHDKPEVLRREIIISELQWYGFCMFKALAALHKQGVIHRDVKPGNFLFSRNIRRGYLIDFNLALDQYDSISNNSVISVSAKTSQRSYMGEIGASCQRSVTNGKSATLKKPNIFGSQTEVGIASHLKASSYPRKEEMKISIKPLSTWCENKENSAVYLKHLLPLGSNDIKSHRKFGQEILNTDIRSKLGASLHPKNVASGWRQSGPEAAREPLPTQGRKELLNLVQEARQNSQQQTSSFRVGSGGNELLHHMGDWKQMLAIKDIAKMRGVEEIWELSKLHDRQQSLPQDLHSVQFE